MLKNSKQGSKIKINHRNINDISELNSIIINCSKKFQVMNLMDLTGKISFSSEYNYKELRERS